MSADPVRFSSPEHRTFGDADYYSVWSHKHITFMVLFLPLWLVLQLELLEIVVPPSADCQTCARPFEWSSPCRVFKSIMMSLQNYSPKRDDNVTALYFTWMFPIIQPLISAARKPFVRKFMKITKPIMELRDLVLLTLVDKVPVYAKVFELMTAN